MSSPEARPTVAVVGGGPAGLRLAVLLSDTHAVTVYDQFAPGGELLSLGLVPGPDGVEAPGPDVATDLLERAMDQGVTIEFDEVTAIRRDGDGWAVQSDGGELAADEVVLAAGAAHGSAPVDGADEFVGRGVSYCAGCDGPMFSGRSVAVVGNGPYAASDARTLAAYAGTVHVVGSSAETTPVPGIVQHPDAVPTDLVLGEDKELLGLVVDESGSARTLAVEGVFVSAPTSPRSGLLADLADLAPGGGVVVDDRLCAGPAGPYVIGDARDGSTGGVAGAWRDAELVAAAIKQTRTDNPSVPS